LFVLIRGAALSVGVITGAANGLGLGLASELASRGFALVLADIDDDALAVAAARLPGEVLAVPTDVTKDDAVAHLAEQALARFGRVDVVCLNAGVSLRGRAWELSVADWRWIYDVNVFGVVHGIRHFVPSLVERGDGHVVITSSNSAVTTLPSLAPYVSSKHAVLAIAEVLQHDLAEVGTDVRVSVVLPGAIRSAMADAVRHRPADYGVVDVPESVLAASRAFLQQHGTDPRAMAAQVLREALDERRFCVFTDPPDATKLRARADALSAGRLVPVSAPVVEAQR
jgi:NADP-dependent 3-hydroxy acid dehydrogenase YdfG